MLRQLTSWLVNSSVYPAIDPTSSFANRPLASKSFLITGASRGIGRTFAIFYARAGASLTLIARSAVGLEETKAEILRQAPDAKVVTFALDVRSAQEAERAVKGAVEAFGRLDGVVANAASLTPFTQSKDAFASDYLVC